MQDENYLAMKTSMDSLNVNPRLAKWFDEVNMD